MRVKKRRVNAKVLAMLFAVTLIVGGAISGSVAWLTAETGGVSSVFVVGNVNVSLGNDAIATYNLNEEGTVRMIPGWTVTINDPPVIIGANSEDCYLFVKIDEDIGSLPPGTAFKDYLAYQVDQGENGWTAGLGTDGIPVGVYYRKVERLNIEQEFVIVQNHEVRVSENITKGMMDALSQSGAVLPKLTFSAYAVQLYKNNTEEFTPAEAWANIASAFPET